VFVALDTALHREVALKQILEKHADAAVSRQRFLREAEVTGGLEHPGVVPVYGLGTDAGDRPYYALRFIKGDSLKDAIARFHEDAALKTDPGRRSLELGQLLQRCTDACNAIDCAHSRGVIHRDKFRRPSQHDPALDKAREAVCLPAMATQPEDRYPTPKALADDLDRWMADEPVTLPPTGSRNPDPITHAPGSHPIETGVGANVAGAASGVAVGAVAGPVGAALGAAAGTVAGGYTGKGIGELIDPTIEDNWLWDTFKSRPYVKESETFEMYRRVYRYGAEAESKYGDPGFDTVEEEVEIDRPSSEEPTAMSWSRARETVKDSSQRTVDLRKQKGSLGTCPPKM
jgi:hypothetical protein